MSVYEIHNGGATVNKDGSVSLTRTFRLYTGNAASRPTWGVVGIGILKYDPHPDDPTCRATDVSSTPVSGEPAWFDVSYTYSNQPFDAGTSNPSGDPGQLDPTQVANPTARPPVIKWGETTRTVPFTKDWATPNRRAVQNSAGTPYEGVEAEEYSGTVTVAFNKSGVIDISGRQQAYLGKSNLAAFRVIPTLTAYPIGTLRCNSWTGTYQYEADYGWYTACEVGFEFRPDGWYKDLVDAGYVGYRDVSGPDRYTLQKFVSPANGQPLDAPVKLNGKGRKLNPGDNPTLVMPYYVVGGGTDDVTVYQRFYLCDRVSFTSILS